MMIKEYKSMIELVRDFPNEATCLAHLEQIRWNGKIVSPFDPESKVYYCKNKRYRCKNTGKYFNVKTDTLFEHTRAPLQKWFLAIWLITSNKKGHSSMQLSRDLDVTQKTAWFMLQRIRNCFDIGDIDLNNHVEVDETYVGGKEKNKHNDKRLKGSTGRSAKGKTILLGMVERKGKLIAKKIENTNSQTLTKIIRKHVKDAIVYTDEFTGYTIVNLFYRHQVVAHKNGQYVLGNIHTNTVEGFWSLFKRGIVGIYHYASPKHMQKYVDEFVFRYNSRKEREGQRFNSMLKGMENRLTYKELIA